MWQILHAWIHTYLLEIKMYLMGHAVGYLFHKIWGFFITKRKEAKASVDSNQPKP